MQEYINKIAEIYFRYGIKSVTMDDLSRELGISKKTLYLHFKDKHDVVQQVINFLVTTQKCGVKNVLDTPGANAIDQLMLMTRFFADHLKHSNPALTYDLQKYYPGIWDEVLQFKRHEVLKYIVDNAHRGVDEGLYRADLNYEIIARIYVSRMEMYQTDLWQPLESYSLEEIFQTLFIYHIRGIASAKGHRYLDENHDRWVFTQKR